MPCNLDVHEPCEFSATPISATFPAYAEKLAEGAGFEPAMAFRPQVFKTCALNRYATLPLRLMNGDYCIIVCFDREAFFVYDSSDAIIDTAATFTYFF